MAKRTRDGPLTEDAAWGRLLNWIGIRPRSEREVRDRFRRWSIDPEMAARLEERLRVNGLLDDRGFAEAFARELAGKGLQGSALRARLASRGLPKEEAARAASLAEPEDPYASALAIAMRRVRTLPADHDAALRRLVGYLGRRGIPAGIAIAAAKQALKDR